MHADNRNKLHSNGKCERCLLFTDIQIMLNVIDISIELTLSDLTRLNIRLWHHYHIGTGYPSILAYIRTCPFRRTPGIHLHYSRWWRNTWKVLDIIKMYKAKILLIRLTTLRQIFSTCITGSVEWFFLLLLYTHGSH